jgi:hypothetical protein
MGALTKERTSRRKRWTTGIGVGALVGVLGVALYNTAGGVAVCNYVVKDPTWQTAYGISYPTELCDQGGPRDGVTVDGIASGYISDTGWRRKGGSGWGAVLAALGFGVLTWLIPVAMGRIQESKRPSRPSLESARAQELDASGRWWLQKDGYWWHHDARTNTWTRGDKLPTFGATRSETWALRRDELLREQNRLLADQNRLLAGLPPTPPEPPVVRAGDPWQTEPTPEAPPRSE